MLHTVLRRKAAGESVEAIRPRPDHPHRQTHRTAPSLASIYLALAEHEKTLTYPDAVEQANAEYAELHRTDSPADTLRPRAARVLEVVSDAKTRTTPSTRHPRRPG